MGLVHSSQLIRYLLHFKNRRGLENTIRIDKFLLLVFWAHLPAGQLVNLAYGLESWFHVLWEGALIPVVATIGYHVLPKGSVWTRVMNGLIAMLVSGWLIHLSGGTIEFHFHVFVFLAVLSYYRDYRVLLPAATFIALHHLILNYVSPYDVFIYGPSLASVFIHALFVALETAYLIFDMLESERKEDALRQATKTEAIGQLTGGIAHDFNNLLTVISGNSELLLRETQQSPKAAQYAGTILHAVGRAIDLTQRLLAFGRQQPLNPRRLDLNHAVTNMERMLHRTLGENITVRTELTDDLWPTFADRAQVESALLNLAVNARDAMSQGGTLILHTENVPADAVELLDVQGNKRSPYVALTVTDTGTGMRREVAERAFDPFFTTKPVGKGTGLGLSMVFGFVKQSGGHVQIQSEVGKGTSVRIYLPRLIAAAQPAVEEKPELSGPVTGTETILVVEDDEHVRAHAAYLLARLGYAVLQAGDGPTAIAVARQAGALHLLFTDVVIPGGMNGRELADELRRSRPNLPVLFTSGYPSSILAHNGHLDEGILLLAKPYRQADLARRIRDTLDASTPTAIRESA